MQMLQHRDSCLLLKPPLICGWEGRKRKDLSLCLYFQLQQMVVSEVLGYILEPLQELILDKGRKNKHTFFLLSRLNFTSLQITYSYKVESEKWEYRLIQLSK